jgi:hypothetical protein
MSQIIVTGKATIAVPRIGNINAAKAVVKKSEELLRMMSAALTDERVKRVRATYLFVQSYDH